MLKQDLCWREGFFWRRKGGVRSRSDLGEEERRLRGLVVIDEAQRLTEPFPVLRVLLDRPDVPARFLLTGRASPEFVRGLSESLAGRVGIVDLAGFDLAETGPDSLLSL